MKRRRRARVGVSPRFLVRIEDRVLGHGVEFVADDVAVVMDHWSGEWTVTSRRKRFGILRRIS